MIGRHRTHKSRAIVYDPYWTTLGGGEQVALAAAAHLARTHTVEAAGPGLVDSDRRRAFGFPDDLMFRTVKYSRFPAATRGADVVVWVGNSPPLPSFGRINLAIVQFPYRSVPKMVRRTLLANWSFACYSQSVSNLVKLRWGVDSVIISPPVDLRPASCRKQQMILAVGRFFVGQHCKRQHDLVEAFAKLPREIRREWRLVLVGSIKHDSREDCAYLRSVQHRAAEVGDIEVVVDASREALDNLFAKASIFWHATGYGAADDDPGALEHFGIVAIEAMSAGAVPLVFDGGGPRDIVSDGGACWRTLGDLVAHTVALIQAPDELHARSQRAVSLAAAYTPERFRNDLATALELARSRREPARSK